MGDFGHLLVCLATLLSAAGGALALAGTHRPGRLAAGVKLLHAAAAISFASLLVLMFLLLSHDYRLDYIRNYADRTMTLPYLVMAIWGGQAGSLLLWAALQSVFTSVVAIWGGGRHGARLLPVALGFLAALQLFFFSLVLFHSNPFELLGTVASHGIGLNPLLRNPYMAIHPPTLYLGFVGFSVPMAFAVAALIESVKEDDWLTDLRPFILFAWVFLSVGNVLGMVWAYEELGWGGYWGWDPVENASFMPWLTGTALVHSALVQGRRGLFRIWNQILIVFTFVLIIFGTFLTRSGVIESVHAFAGATAGPYLLGLIIAVLVLFVGLALRRRHYLAGARPLEAAISREGVVLAANWVFVLSAVFVLLATMSPLFTELFKGEKVAVTPAFFNKGMVPLGLIILVLIGACAGIGWRRPSLSGIGRKFALPLACGVAAAGIGIFYSGIRAPWPVVAIGALGLVTPMVFRTLGGLFAGRRGRTKLSGGLRRRLGAHIVHLSVVCLFVGFTGGAFTEESSRALARGQFLRVGDYRITFAGLREDTNFERNAIIADLRVLKGGRPVGVFSPARHKYHSHPGQPTSEVVIRTGLTEDLFLVLGEIDAVREMAVIRVLVNPLVAWIWFGGLLLVIGTLVALIPAGWAGAALRKVAGDKAILVRGGGFVLFAMVAFAAVVWLVNLPAGILALTGVCLVGGLLLFGGALNALSTES